MAKLKKCVPAKNHAVSPNLHVYPQEATAVLPDGRELVKGMVLTVAGIEGQFRFCYARRSGAEITVYGGTGLGDKGYHSFRTFSPERIVSATANAVTAKLVAKATAAMSCEYAAMTPGQKAAHTKRLKAAAAAQAVSA